MTIDRLADAIIAGTKDLSSSETEILLMYATPKTLESVHNGSLDAPASKRVAARGWQAAKAVARIAEDPKTLAHLARHTSVRVRRQVAANQNIDPRTIEYLWDWAV